MRVLVTGSRDYTDLSRVAWELRQRTQHVRRVTVIHGAQRGADRLADKAAAMFGYNVWRFPAEWDYYRALGDYRKAGDERNREMLDTMPPDFVLAFPLPGSRGTWNMIRQARTRGIPVEIVGRYDPDLLPEHAALAQQKGERDG